MPAIQPTQGRVILYTPDSNDGITKSGPQLAAIVAAVNEDGTVNLAVFDANGSPAQRQNVVVVQEDEDSPEAGGFASWMPYQLGQAAKTEQALAAADAGLALAAIAVDVAQTKTETETKE
jgi:hypothetical protein